MNVLSPIRAASALGRQARSYVRGRIIARRYATHYRLARQSYRAAATEQARVGLYDVGVRHSPELDALLGLPPRYTSLVSEIADRAAAALDQPTLCQFYPPLTRTATASRTGDIGEVADGEVIAIQLIDPLAIDGLAELADVMLAPLERHIYRSHTLVDRAYVYRSPVSRQVPSRSWLWHFDNHPRETLKVMVYLTDVTAGTAPFEYVRQIGTQRPLRGSPIAPTHGRARLSSHEVERYLACGWERQVVVGPRGTGVLFDDNIVHRATLAEKGHRDVVVFQVRPASFAASPRLDPRWTGSFPHCSMTTDPRTLAPQPKR